MLAAFERDADGLSPPADAGVIRAPEWGSHQGINEPLRGAQREEINAFEHQYSGNSELRITLWTTT